MEDHSETQHKASKGTEKNPNTPLSPPTLRSLSPPLHTPNTSRTMGLTADQIAIIKATVPILQTGGEALTTHFYRRLFEQHPEVKVYFNQVHQVHGTQPRALANSILQYAMHIDEPLTALGDLPAQIISKHVALGIPAEGYMAVGVTLLQAIREVLGAEVATDAVIDAWKAAYFQLADILIAAEEAIYAARAAAPGGWRGKRPFVLYKKVRESDTVTSFYWKPQDGKAILDYEPGQYLGMALEINGVETRRNYSLSDACNGEYYRISIKREEGGVVSQHLHDNFQEGAVVDIMPPAGHFVLAKSSKPLVLLSAGIGLTPVLAMLQHSLATDAERPVTFIHFARNHTHHPFHDQLEELAKKHSNLKYFFAYTKPIADAPRTPNHVGRLDHNLLSEWLPVDSRDVDVYFLGPKEFMAAAKGYLKAAGVPENQSKYEFFGPSEALVAPTCPFAASKNATESSAAGSSCPFSQKA